MPIGEETRTAHLGIRTSPALKRVVDQLAKDDGRSVSQYVERVIIAHVRALGLWEK